MKNEIKYFLIKDESIEHYVKFDSAKKTLINIFGPQEKISELEISLNEEGNYVVINSNNNKKYSIQKIEKTKVDSKRKEVKREDDLGAWEEFHNLTSEGVPSYYNTWL